MDGLDGIMNKLITMELLVMCNVFCWPAMRLAGAGAILCGKN